MSLSTKLAAKKGACESTPGKKEVLGPLSRRIRFARLMDLARQIRLAELVAREKGLPYDVARNMMLTPDYLNHARESLRVLPKYARNILDAYERRQSEVPYGSRVNKNVRRAEDRSDLTHVRRV